jgi:hypothetical protein
MAAAIVAKIDFQIEMCPPMAPRPRIEGSGDIGTSPVLGSSSDKSQRPYLRTWDIAAKAQWRVEKLNGDENDYAETIVDLGHGSICRRIDILGSCGQRRNQRHDFWRAAVVVSEQSRYRRMYDPLAEAGGTDERFQLAGWQVPVSVTGEEGRDPQGPGQCGAERSIGGFVGA